MTKLTKHSRTTLALVIALVAGCGAGPVPSDVHNAIFRSPQFAAPLSISPGNEDGQRMLDIAYERRIDTGIIPTAWSTTYQVSDKRLLWFLVTNRFARVECVTITSRISTKEECFIVHSDKVGMLAKAAHRELVSIDYTNTYKASPMGIPLTIFAVTFVYRIVSDIPEAFKVAELFEGKARAVLNPDTGKWELDELSLADRGYATLSEVIAKSPVFNPVTMAVRSETKNGQVRAPTAAVGPSGRAESSQQSFAQLLAAAEAGDPSSQLRVGVAYATGRGVGVIGSEAVRWLESAVAANGKIGATAAGWLGVVHERGLGVSRSGEDAVKWYTRGAELGGGSSAQNLGELYIAGQLVRKDEKLGYRWYARAAELYEAEAAAGDATAAYQAGRIYLRGVGVSRDLAKAVTLLEKASGAGNADASKLLSEIRAQPRGVR